MVSLLPTPGLILLLPQADEREPTWLERRAFAEFGRRFEDETTADWENRWAVERMGLIHVRRRWPIGEPAAIRVIEPEVLKAPFGLAEVHLGGEQIAGDLPSADAVTAARMRPIPGLRPGMITQRFPVGGSTTRSSLSVRMTLRDTSDLPLGPHQMDLFLKEISPPPPVTPPTPPTGGTTPARPPRQIGLTRSFEIVASHDEAVAPVDTPELRAAINRSLRVQRPYVTGREGTTPGEFGSVIFQPSNSDRRALASVAVFVRIEIVDDTEVRGVASVELREPGAVWFRALQQDWARFAPEHLARMRVRLTGVASVADLQGVSVPLPGIRLLGFTDSSPRRVLDRIEADR